MILFDRHIGTRVIGDVEVYISTEGVVWILRTVSHSSANVLLSDVPSADMWTWLTCYSPEHLHLKKQFTFLVISLVLFGTIYVYWGSVQTLVWNWDNIRPSQHSQRTDELKSDCPPLLSYVNLTGKVHKTQLYDCKGCKLHRYTQRQAQSCFTPGLRLAVIGDSRVRNFYIYFVFYLWKVSPRQGKFHHNTVLKGVNSTMEFYWCPTQADSVKHLKKMLTLPTKLKPNLIIMGAGLHQIININNTEQGLTEYRSRLKETHYYLKELSKWAQVLWMPQDPADEARLPLKEAMVTNKLLDAYNALASDILGNGGIPIWWSSYLTTQHFPTLYRDPFHVEETVQVYKTQLLMNMLCNNKLAGVWGSSCKPS